MCRFFLASLAVLFTIKSFAINSASWMEELYNREHQNELSKIVIPGTHNSGTYGIKIASKVARGADHIYKYPIIHGIAKSWSICQKRSIYQQLIDGIRLLDLRISLNQNDELVIVHGLESILFEEVVSDLKEFVSQRPLEVIFLGIKLDWDFYKTSDSELRKQTIDGYLSLLRSTFDEKFREDEPYIYLQDYWLTNTSIQLSNDNYLYSRWFNVQLKDDLYADATEFLTPLRGKNILNHLSLILTPSEPVIMGNITGILPLDAVIFRIYKKIKNTSGDRPSFFRLRSRYALYAFQYDVLQEIDNWLLRWERARYPLNFVSADFYHKSQLVKTSLKINKSRLTNL